MPVDLDALLRSLDRESDWLVERMLIVFLDYDFLDYTVLGGSSTGGHVVTRLAREADRMADQLLAATGRPVPPEDRGRRWTNAEGGNLRPGGVLTDDLHVSSDRLRDAIAGVSDWSALPSELQAIPPRRLLQVIVHHADLGRPWDTLPEEEAVIAAGLLPDVLEAELAGFRVEVDQGADVLRTMPAADGATLVAGPAVPLLAWASRREAGAAGIPDELPRPPLREWI